MNPRPVVFADATAIPASVGGVGRYFEEVMILGDRDERIQLVIVARADRVSHFTSLAPSSTVVAAPKAIRLRPLRLLWEQIGLGRLARRHDAAVIFSPHYTMNLASASRSVVMLHDATFFSDPSLHRPVKRLFFRWWIRTSLKRAARCIVPSQATRDELVRFASADAKTIVVVPHGVDTNIFHTPDAAEVTRVAALVGGTSWIAFLGTLEPRKNLVSLVRAFAAVADAVASDLPDLRLAIAGGKGWDAELDGAVSASPHSERITRLGYLDRRDLPGLLGGSLVVSYPSLGEGFGLPVLEAMACGAAVLTTRRLALPEVGGDAVEYSEPDEAAIADGIVRLLRDPAKRERLGRDAIDRAQKFTWQRTASEHIAVFLSVAGTA